MSYSKFGGVYIDGFLDGLFAYILDASILNSGWHTGSDITTEVNYVLFDVDCTNSFLVGFSGVTQNNLPSAKGWIFGSGTPLIIQHKWTMVD